MNNLERIDMIGRIGRDLQERLDFQGIRAYLTGHGIDTSREYSGPNSKWAYVKAMMASTPASTVELIARELGLVQEAPAEDVNDSARGRTDRVFYSQRATGNRVLSIAQLQKLVIALYEDFDDRDYFQEATGYHCVDAGYVPGFMGEDQGRYALLHLERDDLWPICGSRQYAEHEIFDLIEFMHDLVSKPAMGSYHSYCDCGWHGETWDREAGKHEFREQVNPLLARYGDGWTLSISGEILCMGASGLNDLLERRLPTHDPENVEDRVEAAVTKYRRHGSSAAERREAVRALVDVLEYLLPQVTKVLVKKDEADLFQLANNFGLRHHRQGQRTDYDAAVWLSWMFYFYLATIHAVLHLLERTEAKS